MKYFCFNKQDLSGLNVCRWTKEVCLEVMASSDMAERTLTGLTRCEMTA